MSVTGWVSRALNASLLLAIGSYFAGWAVLALPPHGRIWIWSSGIAWILPVAVIWAAVRIRLLRMERAVHYHLLAAALLAFAVLPLVEASFRVLLNYLNEIIWPIAFSIVALLSALGWFTIYSTAKGMSLAEQQNINSLRIDPVKATWNVNAPLWLNTASSQDKQTKQGTQGLIAIVGASLIVILQLLGIATSPIFVPTIVLVVTLTILVGIAGRHAGLAVQLKRWEQKWNKTIRMSVGPE